MEILLLIMIFTYPALMILLTFFIIYSITLRKKLKTREKINEIEEEKQWFTQF